MSRGKKKIYKKKGNVIKELTRKIISIFSKEADKVQNYKQVCAKLNIEDTDGKNQVIKKIEDLKGQGKLEEVDRGKYILNQTKNYHIGTLDLTSSGNAYFICEDFEGPIYNQLCENFNLGMR